MSGSNAGGRNMVLKLYMSKAYDRMSWVFVLKVLRQFGFGERCIDMVWRLLSNVWFSVIVNVVSHGFFKSYRDFGREILYHRRFLLLELRFCLEG